MHLFVFGGIIETKNKWAVWQKLKCFYLHTPTTTLPNSLFRHIGNILPFFLAHSRCRTCYISKITTSNDFLDFIKNLKLNSSKKIIKNGTNTQNIQENI